MKKLAEMAGLAGSARDPHGLKGKPRQASLLRPTHENMSEKVACR
jgi:hypothetical protein